MVYRLMLSCTLDDQVPPGIALVPRSMGVPISSPMPIVVKAIETSEKKAGSQEERLEE